MDSYADLDHDDTFNDFGVPDAVPNDLIDEYNKKEFIQEDILPPFVALIFGFLGIPFCLCECVWCHGCCSIFTSRSRASQINSLFDIALAAISWACVLFCVIFNVVFFIFFFMLLVQSLLGGSDVIELSGSFSS